MYFSPARSRRILRPGRIEHMSTQRRARSVQMNGLASFAPIAQVNRAIASATKKPVRVTESLHQDPRFVKRAGNSEPSSSLVWSQKVGRRAAHRYSLPPISILSGSAESHPALPQAPAADRRWAERHDGKRNLYLQHAA
jgi:hypothetical protein